MRGLDKFYEGLSKAFVGIYVPATEPYNDELRKSFLNLLQNPETHQPAYIDLSPRALFVRDIHWGVFEVLSSYESLLDAELYVRRFPFTNTRITRVRYLRYVFENHLNEVYIIRERLKDYLKTIETLFASGERRKYVRRITQYLFKFNNEAFKDLGEERRSHVHILRYDDMKLRSIEAMERLSKSHPEEEWSSYLYNIFEFDYKRIRSEKAEEIAKRNRKIESILDEYFTRLYPAVFDEQDNLIIPS